MKTITITVKDFDTFSETFYFKEDLKKGLSLFNQVLTEGHQGNTETYRVVVEDEKYEEALSMLKQNYTVPNFVEVK